MLLATRPSTCARSSSILLARVATVAPCLLRGRPSPLPPTARRAATDANAADGAAPPTTRMADDDLDALYGAAEEEAVIAVAAAPPAPAAPAEQQPPPPAEKPKPAPPPPPTTRAPPSLLDPKQPLPSDLRAAFANAVVLIDKPPGWSSFDVCHALKRPLKALGISKVGHAGTLDPMATGLLVVCTGQGTKSIETFMGRDKAYTATLRLGQATPSQDAETPVCEEAEWKQVTDQELKKIAAEKLTGDGVMQKPPIFSALHAGGGKRLYELAREGGEAAKRAEEARPARPVRVASFELEPRPQGLSEEECARLDAEQAAALAAREAAAAEAEASDAERQAQREARGGMRTPSEESEVVVEEEEQGAGGAAQGDGDGAQEQQQPQQPPQPQKSGRARRRDRAESVPVVPYDPRRDVRFSCVVSKGTYVRTLGADLAELAGTKGHLTALRRTAVGEDLRVEDTWDVRELVSKMREGLAAMGIEEAPPREQRGPGGGGSGRGRRRGKGWRSGGGGGKRAKTGE